MKTPRQRGLATRVVALLLLLASFALPGYVQEPARETSKLAPVRGSPFQMFVGQAYSIQLPTQGGAPPCTWELTRGALPVGLSLAHNGLLSGAPKEAGEFRFVARMRDSNLPPRELQQEVVLRVLAPLAIQWGRRARIIGHRIEGSVKVSNQTENAFDLTAVMLAVAENGRATAVGYQHFTLKPQTYDVEIPFGENLPPGSYELNVDVVGEVARNNSIYRARLVTPGKLQVVPEL